MQNKIIIYTFIGFLFISFSFLTYAGIKSKDIDSQNLWFLYFNDVRSQSIDSNIENHRDNNDFHWIVLADKEKIREGDVKVNKGESKLIKINFENSFANKKITIRVLGDNQIKEIYKNL
ncbi:MAG: hypothetical protein WAV31_04275 [Candidatus Moraniibacteriota bacterium]